MKIQKLISYHAILTYIKPTQIDLQLIHKLLLWKAIECYLYIYHIFGKFKHITFFAM